jgi:HEAT repeat protein
MGAAIGATQDPALVPALLAKLGDEQASPRVRTAATVALGCLCDREPRPWNARLAATGNYRAATRSLVDPETGVLSWW